MEARSFPVGASAFNKPAGIFGVMVCIFKVAGV